MPPLATYPDIGPANNGKNIFEAHIPVLQGFASGDCTRDAGAIRIFLEDGHLLGTSQSYAKNMGLYGQRVGCFSIVAANPQQAAAVESQMKVGFPCLGASAAGRISCVQI